MVRVIKSFSTEYDPSEAHSAHDISLSNELENLVHRYSFLRHYWQDVAANRKVASMILEDWNDCCDYTFIYGQHNNIIAGWGDFEKATRLIGGHYDGPPNSPGADDNASAIASMVGFA